jgi:ribosome biogenesis ATPase
MRFCNGVYCTFVWAYTDSHIYIGSCLYCRGRLDKLLYVPLPTASDRVSILRALAVSIKLGDDVDLDAIGRCRRSEGYSGADLAALLRESGLAVLKEDMLYQQSTATAAIAAATSRNGEGNEAEVETEASVAPALIITKRHFDYAFDHVMPSVSRKDQARYDRMRDSMARARSRGGATLAEGEQQGVDAVSEESSSPPVDVEKEDKETKEDKV